MAETAPAGCIFCGIVNGELRSEKVYEDEEVLAFRDINPKAPVHVLVIPKKHIPSLREVTAAHERLLGHLMFTVSRIAADAGLDGPGYRVLINVGRDAGQVVFHLHVHILGPGSARGSGAPGEAEA